MWATLRRWRYTLAWAGWGIWFAIVEWLAARNDEPGDMLSELVWSWASIKARARAWRWRRIALVAFLAWLTLHLLTGGWI